MWNYKNEIIFKIVYIHTINPNTALRFLGWAALTYMWLEANCLFFTTIADGIHQHNEQIRLKAFEEAKELLKENDEDESEDEGEDEDEVVETVTETVTKQL